MPLAAESPLVVLKIERTTFIFSFVITILISLYCFFGVLVPVLISGDFNSVMTGISHDSHSKKIIIFVLGILWFISPLPAIICNVLRQGDVSFYEDRLEIKPILKLSVRIFYYKNAYALLASPLSGSTYYLITNSELKPNFISHPWDYFKWRYLDSATILLNDKALRNPEMKQQAIDILSGRVLKHTVNKALPRMSASPRNLICIILAIISLLLLSLWSYNISVKIEGQNRIFRGPHDSIYALIDDTIVQVSNQGDVVKILRLSSMGINEPVADLFVEPNGDLLVGLRNSQIIKIFSPQGDIKHIYSRAPSPFVNKDRVFKFTKDTATGILYFADTDHHQIQIYGADESELRTLQSPSGAIHYVPKVNTRDMQGNADGKRYGLSDDKNDPDKSFKYPNELLIYGDKLYAADTDNWRIVVLGLDGTFVKLIPVAKDEESDLLPFPIQLALIENALFVIKRGFNFVGGEVVRIDLTTGLKKYIDIANVTDPKEILARDNDVLIMDDKTLRIFRVTSNGELLGTFGNNSLADIFDRAQTKQKVCMWLSMGSLGAILALVIVLIFLAIKDTLTLKRSN